MKEKESRASINQREFQSGQERYRIWKPIEGITGLLFVEGIHDDAEGMRLILRSEQEERPYLRILFSFLVSYRNVNESYRLKTWRDHDLPRESLYLIDHSEWVKWLREQSLGVLDDRPLTHYFVATEEHCIDTQDAGRLKFTGHERDLGDFYSAADDLDYMHARYYNPQLGRFLGVDPIFGLGGRPQSWNRYGYVFNSPVNMVDPDGQFPASFVAQTVEKPYGWLNGFHGSSTVTAAAPPVSTVTPWQLGVEWLSGAGVRDRAFMDGDVFTEMLRHHDHVQDVVERACATPSSVPQNAPYRLDGVGGVSKYAKDYSTLATGGATGNLAVTFLGSYNLSYTSDGTSVRMRIANSSTAASGFRPPVLGYTNWWGDHVGDRLNRMFSSGPMSRTSQTIHMTEACP